MSGKSIDVLKKNKMKSSKWRDRLKEFKTEYPLTPDECFKKPKYSKDYQIGNLIGQTIVPKLPTLSSDGLKTFNVIQIPENLEDLWKIKEDEWSDVTAPFGKNPDKEKSKELFHRNLKWYKANIEHIFLPKEIEFIIYDFYEDEFSEDMRKGFDDAIWDCDSSHYVFSSAKIGDITSTITIKMKYNG